MGFPFPPELSRRDRPADVWYATIRWSPGVRGIHPTVAVPFRTGASGLGRIVAFWKSKNETGFCHVVAAVTA